MSAPDHLVAEGIPRLLDRLQEELVLDTARSIADMVVVMKKGRDVNHIGEAACVAELHGAARPAHLEMAGVAAL